MAIYLDYNATTPIDPRVLDVMMPFLNEKFGKASSRDHAWGWDAAEAAEDARLSVATAIGAKAGEVIFTCGATESLNTVIKGFAGYRDWARKKIVTCATEHEAVLAPCRQLQQALGIDVEILQVDRSGNLDLNQLEQSVRSDRQVLVAIMAANNEIGVIHPIRQIAAIAHRSGALLLCDMTQAVGKIAADVYADDVDLAVFSAHKIYGPKGVGALWIRSREPHIRLEPLIAGGGQEQGLRGGTLNVPGIVGFGEACRIAQAEWQDEASRVGRLRDRLEQALMNELEEIWINSVKANRIPNTSNIAFAGIDARTLIRDMHDIAVSSRAACSSNSSGPSHVLKAIGLSDDEAYSCIRFSLGRFTSDAEIDEVIKKIIHSIWVWRP